MTQQSEEVVTISGLRVRYGHRTAVENLSIALSKGHCLGILGLNGAGKTSTIRALLGMVKISAGEVRLFGEKPGTTKSFSQLGFAPEEGVPPEFLTGREYLSFVGRLRGVDSKTRKDQVLEILDWFELLPGKLIREYSKGMKRRLVLAQAFLGGPRLLVLDEPLNGLDPLMIMKLRERLAKYHQGGGTVLYCSHILAEVEKTCTDIAILSEGALRYEGTLEKVRGEYGDVEQAFAKLAVTKC